MSATNPGKLNARNPLARATIPGFTCVGNAIVAAPMVRTSCSATSRKLAIAAAIVAPQGHAITIALRTLMVRRALVLNAR